MTIHDNCKYYKHSHCTKDGDVFTFGDKCSAYEPKVKAKPFSMQDPFNPSNHLIGDLLLGGDIYGDVHITRINEEKTDQYIHCTPKFRYPNGRTAPYRKGERIDAKIGTNPTVYEKLDGTNILAYSYQYHGKTFITYKTRLVPLLRKEGYSNWIYLWDLATKQRPEYKLCLKNIQEEAVAFELFGSLNPIILHYDVPIDIRCLYRIRQSDGAILQPQYLLPTIIPFTSYADLENMARERFLDNRSAEGYVIYTDDQPPIKCKPWEVVVAGSKTTFRISKDDIRTTIMNCLETTTDPESLYKDTITLLKEVYSDRRIDASRNIIRSLVENQRKELELTNALLKVVHQPTTVKDVIETYHFSKKLSSRIYNILKRRGLLL